MALKYCDQRVCISGHTHISKTTCSNCTNFLCINLGCAFSALTLLVGRQKGHPACKKTEWWGAGMVIWLERGADLHCIWPSWCHCHSLSLALLKSRLVLPFWYRLTWVVPDKGPLNDVCVCVTLAVDRSFWWQCYKLCTRTSSFVDDDMTSCSHIMAIMTMRIGHMLRLIQQHGFHMAGGQVWYCGLPCLIITKWTVHCCLFILVKISAIQYIHTPV